MTMGFSQRTKKIGLGNKPSNLDVSFSSAVDHRHGLAASSASAERDP
jgi:hypothetical protein